MDYVKKVKLLKWFKEHLSSFLDARSSFKTHKQIPNYYYNKQYMYSFLVNTTFYHLEFLY